MTLSWRVALWMTPLAALALQGCATLGSTTGSGATALPGQLQALDAGVDPASPRYIFFGVALSDMQPVFDRDVQRLDQRLRAHYGADYRSVLLSNRRVFVGERELPLATVENIEAAVRGLVASSRPQDRFIVLFTGHGAPGWLGLDQSALADPHQAISSKQLAGWMNRLSPNRTWLLISSCFSGSHLAPLTRDLDAAGTRIVMTASAADRASLGCSTSEIDTWFIEGLLRHLDFDRTFSQVWADTTRWIGDKEAGFFAPSLPQVRYGLEVRDLAEKPLSSF